MLTSLQGANAILTGGSQGLGPLIGRALAQAGVNVALAARSREKLEAVAAELRALGVRAAPIATDITRAADRERLLCEAEAALGPIDILINNAGVENAGSFLRRTPEELEQVIATNVAAPVHLTRMILPGMLERRRGHIVNMASLAGKTGTPHNATYSATKAALIAWSMALRVELEGTGVGVSVVSPGFITGAGMFASHRGEAHWLLGVSRPEAVVRGVLRALRTDAPDVIVAPFPSVQFMQVSLALMPRLTIALGRWLGIYRSLRRLYDKG